VLFLWVSLAVLPWAMAQQTPGTGSGTDSPGEGETGVIPQPRTVTPNPVPSVPSNERRTPQGPTIPEIIYIAGSVMQEDGSPPPFGTVIELDCGDTITREATVDANGRFGFEVGSSYRIGRVMPDPSDQIGEDVFDADEVSQNPGALGWSASMRTTPLSVRLLRCEVRAKYAGYRSTSVRMRPGTIFGYTEVDPILLYRIQKVQGTSVSLTSMLAPKAARKAVEQASKALEKDRFDEADRLLRSAIDTYPENAEAWYILGELKLEQDRLREARESYSRALEIDKLFVRPYLRLARLSAMDEDWESAADFTDQALVLDPIAFPEAYYLNALAYYGLEDLDAAERSARKGQRLDLERQYPQLHLVLANILLLRQDSEGAVAEMRKYLKAAPDAADAPLVRSRIQEKEDLAKAQAQ